MKGLDARGPAEKHMGLWFRVALRGIHEHPDSPDTIIQLRACDERPCDCSATEHGDEFSPSNVDCHLTPSQWDRTRCDVRKNITPQSSGL
jgi:hypothetical protein